MIKTVLSFVVVCACCVTQVRAESDFELTPSLYVYGVYGTSSADDPGSFAPGGHDPNRDQDLMLQSLEPSLSMRWGEYIQGFATGLAYTDENDDLEWEWEEFFLKIQDLDMGLELRGGRMLSRVGFHNPTHLHSWSTVDAPLPHAIFLGEDGLALNSADLTFHMDTRNPTYLTIGFGQRPAHDHDHGGHSDEEDHDHDHDADHDEDHDADHDEDHDDDHDHAHEGYGAFEEYRVADDVITLGLRHERLIDDFNQLRFTAYSGAGDSEIGESSWFAGAGFEYEWRENGLEPGGRSFRWRTEAIRFLADNGEHDHDDDGHDDHEDDHDHDADHDEDHDDHDHEEEGMGSISSWGITSEIYYIASDRLHPFVRIDHVAGSNVLEAEDWTRYSAGVVIPFLDHPHMHLRLQANADERGEESEESFWAQLGFSWGGPEVR